MENLPHNPLLLRDALFARCKKYWAVSLSLNVLVFLLAVAVVLSPGCGKVVAILAILVRLCAEGAQWYSDHWKSLAQSLHRKLDLHDAFGWPLAKSDVLDLLERFNGDLDGLTGDSKGNYFASGEQVGSVRAAQNVCESSWWSMHLARNMGWLFSLLIFVLLAASVLLLNISIHGLSTTTAEAIAEKGPASGISEEVVKIVTASIMTVFSLGLLRFAHGYFTFSSKSKDIRDRAEALLSKSDIDDIQVIKLWQDYHLARAAAPILPSWLWKLREKKLNLLWQAYMHSQTS